MAVRYWVYNKQGELVSKRALTLRQAEKRQAKHRDVVALKRKDPDGKIYQVLVQKRVGTGWRTGWYKGRQRLTIGQARAAVAAYEAKNLVAKVQKRPDPTTLQDAMVGKWLSGDLDFDRSLMLALAYAARDARRKLHVNYGKRTYKEQEALYAKYGPGRAARPGTSRHETGKAADVVWARNRATNLGSVVSRRILRKHGVCLPVAGEPWHAELGSVFRA